MKKTYYYIKTKNSYGKLQIPGAKTIEDAVDYIHSHYDLDNEDEIILTISQEGIWTRHKDADGVVWYSCSACGCSYAEPEEECPRCKTTMHDWYKYPLNED